MPWQSAPPLIIIIGAFSATGLFLNLADRLVYGRNRRVEIGQFEYSMDYRDKKISDMNKDADKIVSNANMKMAKAEVNKQLESTNST